MFGSLFLAFDEDSRLWFVGPITLRRTLLQFLAAVLNKSEYAGAMAGCSIAIHALYGLSVAQFQPYTDDQASLGEFQIGDLNRLAVFHSSVQVLILIIGLCSERPQKASNGDAARDGNGDAIAVVSFIVVAIATIVTTFEIIRIHNKNKNNGDDANAAYAIELTAADHAFATDSSLPPPGEGLSFFLSDAAKERLAKEEAAAPQPGACDACRSKKIKCDGEKPCSHCLSRGLTCVNSQEEEADSIVFGSVFAASGRHGGGGGGSSTEKKKKKGTNKVDNDDDQDSAAAIQAAARKKLEKINQVCLFALNYCLP